MDDLVACHNLHAVEKCKEYSNFVSLRNPIRMVWVPGHVSVNSNEEADKLAKAGSNIWTRIVICCLRKL